MAAAARTCIGIWAGAAADVYVLMLSGGFRYECGTYIRCALSHGEMCIIEPFGSC